MWHIGIKLAVFLFSVLFRQSVVSFPFPISSTVFRQSVRFKLDGAIMMMSKIIRPEMAFTGELQLTNSPFPQMIVWFEDQSDRVKGRLIVMKHPESESFFLTFVISTWRCYHIFWFSSSMSDRKIASSEVMPFFIFLFSLCSISRCVQTIRLIFGLENGEN